jgi:hypothetical protein
MQQLFIEIINTTIGNPIYLVKERTKLSKILYLIKIKPALLVKRTIEKNQFFYCFWFRSKLRASR